MSNGAPAVGDGYGPDDGLLVIAGLTKRFGGLVAVDDLSFAVQEGEILGFIGPNGAGKSTTFDCVTGFSKPTAGTVWYHGQDVTRWPAYERIDRGMTRTFQSFRPLRDRPVVENVQLSLVPNQLLSFTGLSDETRRQAVTICERVGLGDRLERLPSELSHEGMLRLEVGRALGSDPDLILIDEPFSGLAGGEVRELSALLRSLRDEGLTLVVIDHNMRGLLKLIDRTVVIQFGRKIAEGAPEEIREDEAVQEAYFGGGELTETGARTRPRHKPDLDAPMLDASGVQVSYGQVTALRGIDLEVDPGEFVGVIGPNGAGKSTLVDAITGFATFDGEIRYRGIDVSTALPSDLVADGLVHCTESGDLFGYMSVEDNLRLGTYRRRGHVESRLERVYEVFPVLAERRRQEAHTMSGGEQQMLAIGRALMSDPELLILDEPTLGLAPVVVEDISDSLDELRAEGMTVLLFEQNVTFAMNHCDRVLLLENGKVVREGDPASFRQDDYIRDAYLGY